MCRPGGINLPDPTMSRFESNPQESIGRATVKSEVHGSQYHQQRRVLGRIRDRYAELRRDLFRWVNQSESRRKTLQAAVSRQNRGIMYEKLEKCLDVSRRWVKELVGELRDLGVISTPGNPATVIIPDRKIALLLKDILQTMLPAESILPPARWEPSPEAKAPEGVGNPTPSVDSPPGESPSGSGGKPHSQRR